MVTSPLAWDESSSQAHFRNRSKGQPFSLYLILMLRMNQKSGKIRVKPRKKS